MERLIGLKSTEYEHPADKAALEKLRNSTVFKTLMTEFIHQGVERIYRIQYTGSSLKIKKQDYPEIYKALENAGAALGMKELPALYLQYYYAINAFTTGKKEPLVVVYSGTIDLLEEDELQYIIGHELGHILSDHVLYHMMVQGLVDFINLPAKDLIELPLYYWSRMSELTADRAGLLACQDLNTAIRAMIKMAGLPQSQYDKINVQAFIDQARDFNEKNTGFLDETFKFIAIANSYHPWLVLRAAELLKWVESGEYDRIISEHRAVECTHCGGDIPAKSKMCPICGGKHQ